MVNTDPTDTDWAHGEGYIADNWLRNTEFLRMVSIALKEHTASGSTLEEFEEDYGCKIIYKDGGIADVVFDEEKGGASAFYLKYTNRVKNHFTDY